MIENNPSNVLSAFEILLEEVEVKKKTKGGKAKTTTEWQPRGLSDRELQKIVDEVKIRW